MKAILASLTLAFALPSCDSSQAQTESPSGKHKSTAIIQILPSTPVLGDPALRTENFIANEIASLSMGEVIKLAAHLTGLETRGLKMEDIKNSIQVDEIAGTDMARITVHSADARDPKDTVNGIIEAYIQIRRENQSSITERALDALDEQIMAQSDLGQDRRKDMMVLIQQYGIPFFEESASPLGKTELEMFSESRKRLSTMENERDLLQAKIKVLKENKGAQEELALQLKVLDAQIEALGETVDDRQGDTVDLALKQHTYIQAKEAYLQSRDMLRDMKIRREEARVALRMPINPLIIRQKPE